jgi:cytochrome c-type protein NapB
MELPRSALHVVLAVIAGVSLVGFFAGTSTDDYAFETPLTVHPENGAHEGIPDARSWREMRATPRGKGSGWEADMATLAAASPGVLDDVSFEGTDKRDVIADRAALRAYDGAPPRIPHPVRQDSAPECLACHEDGLRFRGLLAPAMSHTSLTSCTQCHVVEEAPMPGGQDLPADPRAVGNSFAGLPSPDQGPRAWDIAPPQIPHRTFMRERCESCHGVNGRDAIRSSHPYRQSCEQCHAASAEKDLRPGLAE